MATMPGAAVIPARFGESMVLYSPTEVIAVVDGAPVGREGRKFTVQSGKVTRVPYEAGRFILEHMAASGVVRVTEVETEEGVKYDVAQAKEAAEVALKEQDERRFKAYIQDCVDDFVKRNKPVPAPSESILAVINRRGYDLKKYGIVPIGWEDPEKDGRVSQLEAQVKSLQDNIAAHMDKDAKIRELEERIAAAEQAKE